MSSDNIVLDAFVFNDPPAAEGGAGGRHAPVLRPQNA
jgi:hypothetical protein